MPNIQSAFKRMKTSAANRARNREAKAAISTIRAQLFNAIAAGDKAKSKDAFREYCSALDKAAKRGILKANTVNRSKSRAAARLAAVAKAG